ncbi:hypothetical protein [Saccharolobus islandicus]|nr:hypothetical protein [Sulfolobus islandicus]
MDKGRIEDIEMERINRILYNVLPDVHSSLISKDQLEHLIVIVFV